jgi:hypothetical protein
MVLVDAADGATAILMEAQGNISIVWQSAAGKYSVGKDTASRINVYQAVTTFYLQVQNKTASTAYLRLMILRNRHEI